MIGFFFRGRGLSFYQTMVHGTISLVLHGMATGICMGIAVDYATAAVVCRCRIICTSIYAIAIVLVSWSQTSRRMNVPDVTSPRLTIPQGRRKRSNATQVPAPRVETTVSPGVPFEERPWRVEEVSSTPWTIVQRRLYSTC